MDSLCLLKSNPFFKLPPIVFPTDFNADVNAFECEGGGFHAENVFIGDIRPARSAASASARD